MAQARYQFYQILGALGSPPLGRSLEMAAANHREHSERHETDASKQTGPATTNIPQLPAPVAQRMLPGLGASFRSLGDDTATSPATSVDATDRNAPPVPLPGSGATGSGPMARPVTIPPRPKPGRKPIRHEDAQDCRRVQNRVAQRNFRDRRQRRVEELEEQLQKQKEDYEDQLADLQRQVQQEKNASSQWQNRAKELDQRVTTLEWHSNNRARSEEHTSELQSR